MGLEELTTKIAKITKKGHLGWAGQNLKQKNLSVIPISNAERGTRSPRGAGFQTGFQPAVSPTSKSAGRSIVPSRSIIRARCGFGNLRYSRLGSLRYADCQIYSRT